MPFVCKFQLNNGAIKSDDKLVFIKFDKSFGDFFSKPAPIAEILFNEVHAYTFSNCPCFPSAKGNLTEGEILKSDTIIGYFSAEGDEIPYNKP